MNGPSESLELFGSAWAEAWGREITESGPYRRAAREWEGAMALVVAPQARRGAWADLWHGECRAARPLRAADLDRSRYVLEAELEVWEALLSGELDPIWALLRRRVRVTKGSFTELLPWATAARELVNAARRVSGDPPRQEPLRPEAAGNGSGPGAPGPDRVFQTTTSRGLRHDQFPMRLWQKAKRRGIWNPVDIDMTGDRADWLALEPEQQDVILRLTSLFQAGEESVVLDLLPLMQVIAAEGRLEEELYLTSFLWEEAKHVEMFRRFFDEVARHRDDLSHYHSPSYRRLFYEELPEALYRLRLDVSPVAQAEASVTYNMIVEGVLAETGYRAFYRMLRRHHLMPGMQEAVGRLQSDEARHLAYGVFLLSRLVAEHGDEVWGAIERQMERLLPLALGVVEESFDAYDSMPFGLERADFIGFATRQFDHRLRRIERARSQGLDEILASEAGENP